MFTILFSGILIVSILYFIVIILIDIGLFRLKPYIPYANPPVTKVSIIIPARNEESTISDCLNDLESQDYPSQLMEIVVVNDHSTDLTEEKVIDFASAHHLVNLRLIQVGETGDGAFKKHSIRSGVESTTGELILTTDADTRPPSSWVSAVAGIYEQNHPEMILGPVSFYEDSTFFERMQCLEFSGLMAATAGSCSEGFPLMCNGANLAFSRRAYLETIDRDADNRFASGDDLFLLMKIKKKFGAASIRFLFAREVLISTKAKKTTGDFLSQRLRWVSKSRGYTDPGIMAISILTWLFNLILFSGMLAGIFSYPLFLLSISLFGLKVLLEFPAVYRILKLTGRRDLLMLYPLVQLLNLVYVTGIGILGNVLSSEWKGRIINPGGQNTQV